MNYRYTYFQYGPGQTDSGPEHGDSEHHMWEPGGEYSHSFSNRSATDQRMFRSLPWIGAAAIGLGILIIVFPMLLVMAVATLFFFMGAICLGLWWQLRAQSRGRFDPADEWDHLKGWFRKRFA